VGSFLPTSVTQPLRGLHRRMSFERALRQFKLDPRGSAEQSDGLFDQLVYGWGNSGWSGNREFLQACVTHALTCSGAILECGSGLTTLLLGIVAQSRGLPMWTLEHMPVWAERVQAALGHFRIATVNLRCEPLQDYGAFDWYRAPCEAIPGQIELVVCDGPPASTRGGRYGLGEVMRERLGEDCTILLDDAERADERSAAFRWSRDLGMSCDLRGGSDPYFVLERMHSAH
jgi:hypothetical protein